MRPAFDVVSIAVPPASIALPGRFIENALASRPARADRWLLLPNPLLATPSIPSRDAVTAAMASRRPVIFADRTLPLAYLFPPRFARQREHRWPLRFLSAQSPEVDALLVSGLGDAHCDIRRLAAARAAETLPTPFAGMLTEGARRAAGMVLRERRFRLAYALPHRFNDGLIYLSLLPRARPGTLLLSPRLAAVAAKRLPRWPRCLIDEEPYFSRLVTGQPGDDLTAFYYERVLEPAIPVGMAVQVLPPFPWVLSSTASARHQIEFAVGSPRRLKNRSPLF